MIAIHKILVPVDFSPRCAWTARYASNLGRLFKSEMFYLHVGDPSLLSLLQDFVETAAAGVPACATVQQGDPAATIVEFARDRAIDLIVMPTHAHGRFRRYLLGSVAAKVLHDAACPVWTGIHHQDAPPPDTVDIQNIVCAVEADPICVPLIRWTQQLAESLNAKLHLIHAVSGADETSDNRGEIEVRRYLFHRAETQFKHLLESEGITARVALAGGPIVRVVRETALRERAGLVAIGRGRTQAGLGRLRTHAYAIIRESPCPVVSI